MPLNSRPTNAELALFFVMAWHQGIAGGNADQLKHMYALLSLNGIKHTYIVVFNLVVYVDQFSAVSLSPL